MCNRERSFYSKTFCQRRLLVTVKVRHFIIKNLELVKSYLITYDLAGLIETSEI